MKYFSEITEKLYDTIPELEVAEEAFHAAELEKERKKQEQETLKLEVDKAVNKAAKLIENYRKKYGRYDIELKHIPGFTMWPFNF